MLLALMMILLVSGKASNDSAQETHTEEQVPETTVAQSYEQESRDERVVEEVVSEATETTVTDIKAEQIYIQYYTEQDAIDIAKVLYTECRGVKSVTEQACVAWTVLNRVDQCDSTISSIVRAPHQYAFYESTPVDSELLSLAYNVLDRWNREKNGDTNVGRVLPMEYTFFEGDGYHNYFRDNFDGSYNIWDYSLESPYES